MIIFMQKVIPLYYLLFYRKLAYISGIFVQLNHVSELATVVVLLSVHVYYSNDVAYIIFSIDYMTDTELNSTEIPLPLTYVASLT